MAEETGRGFPVQRVPKTPKCSVATEKREGVYEKGAELPRNVRSSQPSLDSFIYVGWMLLA